ncbi:hypothetical protein [Ectothiorhodospira variabilis]|uniref:hypothetical protein n=1 Tax=Ectothiorhodospira variabilis TaxID=505694 RepID=UPI001EFC23BB|nr:hypothetical protein [Ectothiorhodospira variabilis]MCG5496592.1 hypothetical protein [Ectothiorhodospira variabilis]
MSEAIAVFLGAVIGSVTTFLGVLYSARRKSANYTKEVIARVVTEERAKWRQDMRVFSANYVAVARQIMKEGKASWVDLEECRVHLRLRLNPNSSHELDRDILQSIDRIRDYLETKRYAEVLCSIDKFEKKCQLLIKQEWDKSKSEAERGALGAPDGPEKAQYSSSLVDDYFDYSNQLLGVLAFTIGVAALAFQDPRPIAWIGVVFVILAWGAGLYRYKVRWKADHGAKTLSIWAVVKRGYLSIIGLAFLGALALGIIPGEVAPWLALKTAG